MPILIASSLFLTFLFLSGIHFYWAFGGKWGASAVIPTKDDTQAVMNPGIVATLIVALGLLAFGLLPLILTEIIHFPIPLWLSNSGLWIIAGIFTLRSIGEFNYVGFFKKHKHTKFGKNDSKIYSPLCLLLGVLAFVLELMR